MPQVKFFVNGKQRTVSADPNTPLLWVLRESLGLTGTKYGCGQGLCGACTVHVNGEATRSCVTTLDLAEGKRVVTIEGLASNVQNPLLRAWIAEEVSQCGYCQPGQILSAAALLARKPNPSDSEIDEAMAANLCRCGTYPRIRRAIHRTTQEGGRR
ncbi:MAG: (2Fe-2S)-binding protein [Ignavibacteriales bacterium]|nr:(2Fe-2S)-binding protein [Ignavibacteriales bacterium]